MKNITNKIKSLVLITSFIFLPYTGIVEAVEYGSIGGRPANPDPMNERTKDIFVYDLDVNQSKSDGIRVYNNTADTKTIFIYAVDSVKSSDGAFACEQFVDQKDDVGSWITVENPEIVLESGKNQEVKFNIKVPQNASVGEHNGCIVIQEKKESSAENTKNSGVLLSFRSATRVAITIPGEIKKSLEITGLKVQNIGVNKYQINSSVKNNGNVSLDADVSLRVRDAFGNTVKQYVGVFPVLRDDELVMKYEFQPGSFGGVYSVNMEVKYDSNISNNIGEKSEQSIVTLTSTTDQFITQPDNNVLVITTLVILTILIVAGVVIRKILKIKQIKKSWVVYEVQKGEELPDIAQKHNVKWQEIAEVNRLRSPYFLNPGDKLYVPPISNNEKKNE